jgi:phage shock protein PspC (stress-responsive transcriptional regulator)/predicted membrane protein
MNSEPRNHDDDGEPTGPTQPMTSGDPLAGQAPGGDTTPKGDTPPPPPPGAAPSASGAHAASYRTTPVKRLTRSSSDKLIGGVAGGLGRYFGIDPILFRIAFVVLTFAGGVGALAYIGLLAFVPADDDSRPFGASREVNLIGAVILGILVVIVIGPPVFFIGPVLIPLALLAGLGLVLWRAAGGRPPTGDPAKVVARVAIALLIGIAAAGGFAGVFILAATGGGTVVAILAIIAGVALVVSAFAGGARWLVVPALVLVLPLAIVAAADLNVDGGIGERTYRPANVAELRSEYGVGMGELSVDMRDVELPAGDTEVQLDVGVGHAIVRVPENACVTSDVEVGAGYAQVLDRTSDGLDVAFVQAAQRLGDSSRLHLDADIGIGALEVVRGNDIVSGPRQIGDNGGDSVACP